jgi:hypothetical protein
MVSIALVVIISAAVYFAVDGAFDSWVYCRDQLSLQKVLIETMDKVVSGTVKQFGLKDSLEIVAAGSRRVEFVPPWIDDTHSAADRSFIYTLNGRLQLGSPVPIGEIRMPETNLWRLVPVQVIPLEDNEATQVKLGLSVPEGSDLRFFYHPDWKNEPDAARKIIWDPKTKELLMEHGDQVENLSKNFFGMEILNVKFSYFTSHNDLVTDREWVDEEDLKTITGVEAEIEARLGVQTQKLVRFVNLRNAPMRTGYLTLKKDMKIPIADSKNIRTFLITNLSGISNNDELMLEAVPRAGTPYRARFEFEKIGSGKPVLKKVTVQYPPRNIVYTDYPKTTTDLGINLLLLGNDGLYDYDDDEDTDDAVFLEGDVDLYVTEMTIKGAGLFVRP